MNYFIPHIFKNNGFLWKKHSIIPYFHNFIFQSYNSFILLEYQNRKVYIVVIPNNNIGSKNERGLNQHNGRPT